jgi:hypothetical protein
MFRPRNDPYYQTNKRRIKMPITEGNTRDNIKEQAKSRPAHPPPAPRSPRQRTTQLEKDLTRAIYKLVTDYTEDTELQVKSIEINMVDIASDGSTRPEYAFGGVSVEVVV